MGLQVFLAADLLSEVTSGISTVISWIGTVIEALLGTGSTAGSLATLAPLFAIGISISAILLGVKLIKSIVWGA